MPRLIFADFSLREFVLRRLARIYPLHIVTLLAMLMLRFARIGLVAIGILAVAPVQTEVNTGYSFFLNVLLLQSMGFLDHLSWNGPSWSISTEFYTYLLFGVLLLWAQRFGSRRLFYVASAVLVIGSVWLIVVALGKQSLDFHTDFGFRSLRPELLHRRVDREDRLRLAANVAAGGAIRAPDRRIAGRAR